MPRKKNVASKGSLPTATRRSTRQSASRARQEDDVPEVFQDMLIEAYHNNPQDFAPSPRSVKRRKVEDEQIEQPQNIERFEQSVTPLPPSPIEQTESLVSSPVPERVPQVVFNNDFSDEDDSDISFEDVDISRHATPTSDNEIERPQAKTLQLDLSTPSKAIQSKQSPRPKTKPLTKLERAHRLNVHKWHLLCLMLHFDTVNRWCDDETVQKTLKPLIRRTLSNQLHLPETRTQAERKYTFDIAIEEICRIWRLTFRVTTQGMRKAHWRDQLDMESELENAPDPVDFEDFQAAAKTCAGSRDTGAQLFCALLRSLAVDTRLVCSLQVLPFGRATTANTPQKARPTYISAGAQDFGTATIASRAKKKKIVDSPYPIWWIEVFSPSITAWIPLDPLVRNTINKPRTGFEPPASDTLNNMLYVIAFEDDGNAKDVTRRYTSYYNAKTRRTRVETTKGGPEWFASVMDHFTKSTLERHDRNTIEDAALHRRVAQEGMPKNVQDLKDHPVYVLERHLRNSEVIEPKRECGKFSVGTGKNARLESVYRREDVHSCRSSEGWYRRGRDIQPGQQPLKRAMSRKKRAASVRLDDDDEGEEEDDSVPLYAEFQTELYIPPPIVDGRLPRNGYGNLDVYVPSMIPAGGMHVRHTLATQAAKTLKIDAADAVTGFVFKGRQGTAVLDGVVIDAQYTAIMLTTIKALEDQLEVDVNAQRSAILSSVWKKMYAVLKVRQRIQEDYGEKAGIDMDSRNNMNDDDDNDPSYEDDADGGGFMPDVHGEATAESRAEEAENLKMLRDRAPIVLPSLVVKQRPVAVRSPHKLPEKASTITAQTSDEDLFGDDEVEPGGLVPESEADDAMEGGGFIVENHSDSTIGRRTAKQAETNTDADANAGGFVPDQDDQSGGGFIPEDNTAGSFVPEDDTNNDGAGGFIPEDDVPHDGGGGFLPEDNPIPVTTTHPEQSTAHTTQLPTHVSPPISTTTPGQAHLTVPPTSTQSTNSTTRSRASRRNKAVDSKTAEEDDQGKDKGKEKDNDGSLSDNSLPSHDPEEDDLEMQWVEDAFED